MKPQHKLGMLAMMSAMISIGNTPDSANYEHRNQIQIEPEWKRKKCKSCKKYPQGRCSALGIKPTSKACKLYTKK